MTVFDPLLPYIDRCDHLVIAPDGDLNLLPFEILQGTGRDYLIDEFEISYVGTGRDLLESRNRVRSSQQTPPVVIADPAFGRFGFTELPGARHEGRAVAAILGVSLISGAEASKSRITDCHSPQILHIATHAMTAVDAGQDKRASSGDGYLRAINRITELGTASPFLRSFLLLAGAGRVLQGVSTPESEDDGILTASDVLSLDLNNTDLVVLSSDSALSEVHAGEGIFGLRRAFALAGASTVIASLWQVPDMETAALFEAFYTALVRGLTKAGALRRAKLMIRERFPHPFYWGGFICDGDPGTVSNPTRS